MAFTQIIPASGQDLIAKATAGVTVHVSGFRGSSVSFTTDYLKEHPEIFTNGTIPWTEAGSILSTSVTEGIARIIGSFEPTGDEDAFINLACVFAYAGSEGSEVPLCWIFSESEEITIPAELVSTNIAMNLQVTDGAVIETVVQGASFITTNEWERVVTTHKAGDSARGDFQHIKGHKLFDDGLQASEVYIGDSPTRLIYDGGGYGITVSQDELPEDDQALIFGVKSVDSDVHDFQVIYDDEIGLITKVKNLAGLGPENNEICVTSDIISAQNEYYNIGSDTNGFRQVWTDAICVNTLKSFDFPFKIFIEEGGSLLPETSYESYLGSSEKVFGKLWASKVRCNEIALVDDETASLNLLSPAPGMIVIEPDVNNMCSIGSQNRYMREGFFNTLYTNNINLRGVAFEFPTKFPQSHASSVTVADVKVGCIVMAVGTASDFKRGANSSMKYGDTVIVDNTNTIKVASSHGASSATSPTTSGQDKLPYGSYIALTEAEFGSDSGNKCTVLLMRKS